MKSPWRTRDEVYSEIQETAMACGARMIDEFLRTVTEMGGSHLLIPAMFFVATMLCRLGEDRAATAFLRGGAVCLGSIVVSKLLFLTMGGLGSVKSPSGHTAIATFFYGSIALLCLWVGRNWPAKLCAMAMVPLVAIIAFSRVVVVGHSRSETLIGLIFGLIALDVFRRGGMIPSRPLTALAVPAAFGVVSALTVALIMNIGFIEEKDFIAIAHWLRTRLTS